MKIISHKVGNAEIAELSSENKIINNASDGGDLVGTMYFEGYDKVIIYQHHITPDFFDLKNKMAGEILQKCSNYRIRLVIIGDFTDVKSNSLRDFIYESNLGSQVNFVATLEEALDRLS